jgi:hypothetical protein
VLAYFLTVAPWARLPVLHAVVKWIIDYVLTVAIDRTELGAFFLFVDVRTSLQGRAFAQAALKHREAQSTGTPAEKAAAEYALLHSFRALVKFTS